MAQDVYKTSCFFSFITLILHNYYVFIKYLKKSFFLFIFLQFFNDLCYNYWWVNYHERLGGEEMGTHLIPREVKGEARILLIFTQKGFFYTIIGLVVGGMIASPLWAFRSKFGWMGYTCFIWAYWLYSWTNKNTRFQCIWHFEKNWWRTHWWGNI